MGVLTWDNSLTSHLRKERNTPISKEKRFYSQSDRVAVNTMGKNLNNPNIAAS